jgi:hypothetical protein
MRFNDQVKNKLITFEVLQPQKTNLGTPCTNGNLVKTFWLVTQLVEMVGQS